MRDQQLDQVEAILSFRDNYTGFTTRELWETGGLSLTRFSSVSRHAGEHLMITANELFPIRKSSDIEKRNMLVAKALEELKKVRTF